MTGGKGVLPGGWTHATGEDLFEFIRGVSYKKADARESATKNSVVVLRAGNLQNGGILATVGTGTTPRRNRPEFWQNGTVPWIASAAVNSDFVSAASELVTESAIEDTKLKLYPPGTLLIALYGEGKTRGKTTELMIDATINQALGAIQFHGSAADMKDFIKSSMISAYERMRENSMGGVQPNLNLDKVRNIHIPIAPLEEQRVILASIQVQLNALDKIVALAESLKSDLTQLDQSILAKAFRGELVPQDPKDEPASELLARIRHAKAQTEQLRTGNTSKRKSASTNNELVPVEPQSKPSLEDLVRQAGGRMLVDEAQRISGLGHRTRHAELIIRCPVI